MVEIVHFVLGAAVTADSIFRTPKLVNESFSVEFDLPHGVVTAERYGREPNVVYVTPSSLPFPINPGTHKKSSRPYFPLQSWRLLLGTSFFNLPLVGDEGGGPSFRALLGYFARRTRLGGMLEPHRAHRDQQIANIQINLSFLFDLDHSLPMQLETVRKREKGLRELRAAARSGALGAVIESVAQLRPKLAAAEAKVRRLTERLRAFVVLDAYTELTAEVAELGKRLRIIAEENLIDQERLVRLFEARDSERDADEAQLGEMFSELESLFSNEVKYRLEDVRRFHRSVMENRHAGLEREIEETTARLANRTETVRELDNRRSELMETLKDKGALDDFTQLQLELSKEQQLLTELRSHFRTAQILEGNVTALEIERKDIEKRIRDDHAAREKRLEHAALITRELVAALYDDRLGNLLVDVTSNGPIFKIQIEGDRSEGIARMEIWCLDMLIARLCAERKIGPGFIIHDSHIFDGVDERQVSAAFQKGLEYAKAFEFQYVITMNSDVFDGLKISDEVKRGVLATRLTDAREDGGIFGTIVEDAKLVSAQGPEVEQDEQIELSFSERLEQFS
jgi:uncharacterized protein YydD (DUF2326 family)